MVGSSPKFDALSVAFGEFQYPQRIDGGFKRHLIQPVRNAHHVSVSSADRWWVQACDKWREVEDNLCFSILSGSMVGSSQGWEWLKAKTAEFQYPQRIDGGFKIATRRLGY